MRALNKEWLVPLLAVFRIASLALAEETINAGGDSLYASHAQDCSFRICWYVKAPDRSADGDGALNVRRDAEALPRHGSGRRAHPPGMAGPDAWPGDGLSQRQETRSQTMTCQAAPAGAG